MYASVSSVQLFYESITPTTIRNNAVTLLFLHEALGSIGQWKNFPQDLCNALGMNGIVYDRQGHGRSSGFSKQRDARYLHDYAWTELPQFMNAVFREDQQILLIGHSDGGTIALLYAHRYPERVKGVCTMAAHVINEPETIAGIAPAVHAYHQGKLNALKKYHGDKTEALFYAWANTWRDASFNNWDITGEIAQKTMPGLFIQGAEDQYGTVQQLELIKKRYKNGKAVLLKNCGHHPHLEQREKSISLICKWVKDLD